MKGGRWHHPPQAFHSNSSSQRGALGDLRVGFPGPPPSSDSLALLHAQGEGSLG